MAKLKILLDDLGNLEVEGTPEELSVFLKTYNTPLEPTSNIVLTQKVETHTTESSENDSSEDIEQVSLPKVSEIVDYILTKPYFEHHTKELQNEFLGRGVKARDEPRLYGHFNRIINNAKKHIEADYNGSWEIIKTLPLEGRTHVNVYRFKKSDEQLNNAALVSVSDESTQPLKDWV